MFASAFRTIRVLAAAAACVGALSVTAVAEAAPPDVAAAAYIPPHPPENMADFMTMVIEDVDAYWANFNVNYNFMLPGQTASTACGPVGEGNAAYCSADDTIYFSQGYATDLWNRTGDFGTAVVIAHEYAHNVQYELGYSKQQLGHSSSMPTELMADCMAGMWANSAYSRGLLEGTDVEEATTTFYSMGDFAFDNSDHHGTPEQRSNAFLTGYNTGGGCTAYVSR